MRGLLLIPRTIIAWIVAVLCHIVFFFYASVMMWFYPNPREKHMLMCKPFVRLILYSLGVTVEIRGVEHIQSKGPYILMANHTSMIDIGLMILSVPIPFRFIAKRELALVPFLGWAMAIQGQYFINRSDSKKAYALLDKIKEDVRQGQSILVFPEGTRSANGQLRSFKKGSFRLAKETAAPVIPCVISGAYDVLPKKRIVPRPGHIIVTFLPPVDPATAETPEALLVEVHSRFGTVEK